ncbi:Uncharacterised protein [Escherichia coli]|uniref:Uncharacterized protein n=1 Tax=Escherichia coli TaxID=562 RepID=A0A376ZT49_ECOLX|nr:Uncharacterised protein [Escherichia coli]
MCFHQIRLACRFLRLINQTGETDVFFYTFLQLFDAVVTVSSFKTGHRAQANFKNASRNVESDPPIYAGEAW